MTAQEQLIKYGNEIKAKSNTSLKDMTAQEIMGQAFVEGICWKREGETRYTSNVIRDGKTIIVNETVISKVNDLVEGRLVAREVKETTEVLKIQM